MANSVYISANLTKQQTAFVRLLDEYEIEIFRMEEIEKLLDQKFENLNEILENLVHKKLLSRIERGKFCKPNFRDEYVIGTFVAEGGVVAYWTALNLHGLTEQFANTIFIQTTHRKKDKLILGTPYKFVSIIPKKRTGITYNGFGSMKYPLTDVEKTLIDCFDQPQYAGGYAELIRALSVADLDPGKMMGYAKTVGNNALIKRIGFLAELYGMQQLAPFIGFAKQQVNARYNLIDPLGLEKGEFVAEWKLRLNIGREKLLDLRNKQY